MPLIGWVILISSVLGCSSLGVLGNEVPAEGPSIKTCWRDGVVVIILAPMVALEYYY